jgi:hypothetical protein
MIAHIHPWHGRDPVDHNLAWLLDSGGGRRLYSDPGQWRHDWIGSQRADRNRGGCIEPIVLNDDNGPRLA